MLLFMEMTTLKEQYIAAMGGPTATVGPNNVTVQEQADCLDQLIDHLTRPGMRVYEREDNIGLFWTKLTETMEG